MTSISLPRWPALTLTLLALALGGCRHRAVPLDPGEWTPADQGGSRSDLPLRLDGAVDDRPVEQRVDAPREPTCTPGARLIHLVDSQRRLYTFDPLSPSPLSLLGTLSCPIGGQPFSMAVRREGIAYVLFAEMTPGAWKCTGLARIQLATLGCQAVPAFVCGTAGLQSFGMGYSLAGPAAEETLYIAGTTPSLLARLEPETGKVTPVGPLPSSWGELTGNSKGELWGFFPSETPARVHRLDPSTGKSLQSITLAALPEPLTGAFAFANWGGLFYVFYATSGGATTAVYRLTTQGELVTVVGDTGLEIVGAGVAACK